MKIALIALAAVLPALAFAGDPAPYVVHEGRAVASTQSAPAQNTSAIRQNSAFGTSAIHAGVSPGTPSAAAGVTSGGSASGFRSYYRRSSGRSSGRSFGRSSLRGIATPASSGPPAFATPGAKIVSAGQQPVYSDPGNQGTHSVEGGGFIAMDQSKAHDVGRAPGITWAPPDTPPSASRQSGGGGTGASSNGSATNTSNTASNGPTINVNNGNQNGGGNGNGGGQQDNGGTGFNPAF